MYFKHNLLCVFKLNVKKTSQFWNIQNTHCVVPKTNENSVQTIVACQNNRMYSYVMIFDLFFSVFEINVFINKIHRP